MTKRTPNQDPMIELIKNLRIEIKGKIEKPLGKSFPDGVPEFRKKLSIIADAITYSVLKTSSSMDIEILKSHPAIRYLSGPDIYEFFSKITANRITFQNVLETANSSMQLNLKEQDYPKNILKHPSLKEKPYVLAALQTYLLKGHFEWVSASYSEFKNYLFDASKSELSADSRINCWEAVLYVMQQNGLVSKKFLQDIYTGSNFDIQKKLAQLLDFRNAKIISDNGIPSPNWKNEMNNDAYCIMMGKKYGWGTTHDMVSFPFSQKQLLKMLITERFNEEPSRTKLFSHWEYWTDGKLGSVTKSEFGDELHEPDKDVRISPLSTLSKRSKEMSKFI
jgi:hypothetical protein